MRFGTFIAVTLGLVLVLSAGYAAYRWQRSDLRRPTAGEQVIAFGDSLVTGYGASTGNDFVSVLSKRLGTPIVNAGKNGDTTRSALERLDNDVLAHDPRVVIVLLGGNDALRQIDPEETFANLGTITERIEETGAVVLLVGVRGGILHDQYAAGFAKLADERDLAYVPDILDGIFGHPQYMFDPIHPNDAGNAKMADRLEPVLRALLQ